MDIVASYLQQQKQQQGQFLGRSCRSLSVNENENKSNDADAIVSAAVSSMAAGAARAFQKSKARAERNVEGACSVTSFALTPASDSSSLNASGFAALIPGNSPAEIVFTSGISSFLSLYNAAIIGRLLLSWWPQAPQAIVSPLATLTDPYLNLFRGIIPPLGGTIDLSPILAFVTLDLLTSSAAALPCEMPEEGEGKGRGKSGGGGSNSEKGLLVPRRIPPRAGRSRWVVPAGLVSAAQRKGRRSEQ